MNDLVFVIIKELRAPCGMVASISLVEELIGGTVKLVDALGGVLNGVGVHNVKQNGDAH